MARRRGHRLGGWSGRGWWAALERHCCLVIRGRGEPRRQRLPRSGESVPRTRSALSPLSLPLGEALSRGEGAVMADPPPAIFETLPAELAVCAAPAPPFASACSSTASATNAAAPPALPVGARVVAACVIDVA